MEGKSKPSAAVDSGEVESDYFLPDSQNAFAPSLRVCVSLRLSLPALNLGVRVELGRGHAGYGCCVPTLLMISLLIGVGGNMLAKLWRGLTPAFCQGKLDWTLITTL